MCILINLWSVALGLFVGWPLEATGDHNWCCCAAVGHVLIAFVVLVFLLANACILILMYSDGEAWGKSSAG